jgi:hypothetical protein
MGSHSCHRTADNCMVNTMHIKNGLPDEGLCIAKKCQNTKKTECTSCADSLKFVCELILCSK